LCLQLTTAGCEKVYTDKTGGTKAERPGMVGKHEAKNKGSKRTRSSLHVNNE